MKIYSGKQKKEYKTGLIVGRFQIFHKGHEQMVGTALGLCEKVLILIGSSQESLTAKNPFSYEERLGFIRSVFPKEIDSGTLIVAPLPDIGVGNVPEWGRYVLSKAVDAIGEYPDLLVSGKEERRISWFDGGDVKIAELYIPKSIDVSATRMREIMISGDIETWKKYTSPALWERFGKLRETVVASQDNTGTDSV